MQMEKMLKQRDNGMTDRLEKQTAVPGNLHMAGTTQANVGSCGEEAG